MVKLLLLPIIYCIFDTVSAVGAGLNNLEDGSAATAHSHVDHHEEQSYKILTDDNFEHDTQATTGSTTGDWLILFCDTKQVKLCREILPTWNKLYGELTGRVNVAYVDVKKNHTVRNQFSLGYGMVPYVALLHKGRFYKYGHHGAHAAHQHHLDKVGESGVAGQEEGDQNDDGTCKYFKFDELKHFATDGFKDAEHNAEVTLVPDFWLELKHFFNDQIKMRGGVVNMFLMKQADGSISWGGLFLCYIFPVITVYAFYLVMHSGFYTDDTQLKRRERIEAKNEVNKQMMLSHYRRQNQNKKSHKKWE